MRWFCIFITSVLFSSHVNAQWRQLHDSLMMCGDLNAVCNVPGGMLAATPSGIYYSDSGVVWKHTSSFYTSAGYVLTIANYQVALVDGAVLRSTDMFVHYDTLHISSNTPNTNFKLFKTGKRLIYAEYSNAYISDDYGNTWKRSADVAADEAKFYTGIIFCNDSVCISELYGRDYNYDYYFYKEGAGFTKFFSSYRSSIQGLPMTFHNNTLYYVQQNDVLGYSLDAKQYGYITTLPLVKDSSASGISRLGCHFIGYNKGYWYFLFTGGPDVINILYTKSIYGNLHSIYHQNIYFPYGSVLSCNTADRIYCTHGGQSFLLQDTACHAQATGIPCPFIQISSLSSNSILMYSNYDHEWLASDDSSYRIVDSSNTFRTSIFTSLLPNAFAGTRPFHRLVANLYQDNMGYYISDDNGKTWKNFMLLMGSFSPIYYDDEKLIFDSKEGLLESDDGANTWYGINKGLPLGYTKQLIVNGSKSLVVMHHSPGYYGTWYTNTARRGWMQVEDTVTGGKLSTFNGTPFLTVDTFHATNYFYLDTSSNKWTRAEAKGLPKTNWSLVNMSTPGAELTYVPYDNLYISYDLASSFVKDSTWPATLVPTGKYAINSEALYLSTNAGVWENRSFSGYGNNAFNFDIDTAVAFTVYPNPVTDGFWVTYNNHHFEHTFMNLMDMTGKVCATYSMDLPKGQALFYLSRNGLRKGVYILEVQGDTGMRIAKLMLE
jgi:hypothetical protein